MRPARGKPPRNKPQDGHVVAGVVEWHGSEHQDRASHGKNDESFSRRFGDGQLGKAEFKAPMARGRDRQAPAGRTETSCSRGAETYSAPQRR